VDAPKLRSGGALHVSGLDAGYRGRPPVLQGLALPEIRPGEVVSLIGPNGAGKTTLLRALAGLVHVEGSIRLGERELVGMSLAERARYVTYMPQTLPQGVALTLLETVIGALRASGGDEAARLSEDEGAERALAVLRRIGVEHLAMEGLDRLSGGQRQLAGLAQALVRAPALLLLDEPTSALDLRYQHRVLSLVRELAAERSMIAMLVLHDMQAAARASDRVVVLSEGRIAAAGPAETAITPALLADVYGVVARVGRCERGMLQVMVDDIVAR
jgi:iron complex transport system ATP-binding protein